MIRPTAASIVLVLLAAAAAMTPAHAQPSKSYFLMTNSGHPSTKFVVEMTKERSILQARKILAGTYTGKDRSISGDIVEGPTAFNPMWRFSLVASSVRFFAWAIELCDANPGYVENHLHEWKMRWCPWGSGLEREVTGQVRRSSRITCAPTTVKYTTRQCLHFFKDPRFPFGPMYCRAQRCREVMKEPVG